MSEISNAVAVDLRAAEGEPITIWPQLGPGMSRDTEPGAQPWVAEFVGVLTDGRVLVREPSPTPNAPHARLRRPELRILGPHGTLKRGHAGVLIWS